MKTLDIIKQLQAALPKYTDKFSEKISVSSLTKSGTTAIATSTAHGLVTGDYVYMQGAVLRNPITITRIGEIATAVTTYDHDLTLFSGEGDRFITIGGATQAAYNGSKKLLSVIDKKTFTFEVTGSPATPATGSPYLVEDLQDLYNGWKSVTRLTDDTFSYTMRKEPYVNASGTIYAHKNMRISGGATFERCLEGYTAKAQNTYWAFVVLGSTAATKDRNNLTDSIYRPDGQIDYRQSLYQAFSVYIIIPAVQSLAARDLRDDVEDMRGYLIHSLAGVTFNSGFSGGAQFKCVFNSDDVEDYAGPYYIHRFNFENSWDINFEDIVDPELSVAWRSFEISQKNISNENEIRNIKGEL